jgi:hypothetical protein
MGPHSGDEVKGVWTNWSSVEWVGDSWFWWVVEEERGMGRRGTRKRDATGEQRRDSHGIDMRIKKRTTGE